MEKAGAFNVCVCVCVAVKNRGLLKNPNMMSKMFEPAFKFIQEKNAEFDSSTPEAMVCW